jgi:hypothetical protein
MGMGRPGYTCPGGCGISGGAWPHGRLQGAAPRSWSSHTGERFNATAPGTMRLWPAEGRWPHLNWGYRHDDRVVVAPDRLPSRDVALVKKFLIHVGVPAVPRDWDCGGARIIPLKSDERAMLRELGVRWIASRLGKQKSIRSRHGRSPGANSCGNRFRRNLLCAFLRSGCVHHSATQPPAITAPHCP